MLHRGLPLLGQQAMQHGGMAMPMAQNAAAVQPVQPPLLRPSALAKFVDPLPLPTRLAPGQKTLHMAMREVHAKVHRDAPPTRFWTYVPSDHAVQKVLLDAAIAPLIEARSGQALRIEWQNHLPQKHFLPIDFSLHGCGRDLPEVRTVAHVHGARVASSDDGYPLDWFTVGHSRTCTYPMEQDATALWYHDHAMGLNRLNTYAGMFGQMFLRDGVEDSLALPAGAYELPLTLVDRFITAEGELFYPVSGIPDHPWVPEFYADTVLVNGKLAPFLDVEPRLYRLRLLNAANSRFFPLSLSNGAMLQVIGGDQGLLEKPVAVKSLLLAPAERVDLLVDFAAMAGQHVQLMGGLVEMMQFRVGGTVNGSTAVTSLPQKLRSMQPLAEKDATVTRTITLDEIQDKITNPMMMLLNRKHWHEPVTEMPKLNATEIWEFVNLTEDTHPMHLHLVRFRILDRRLLDVFAYQNMQRTKFLGEPELPEPREAGWKDVVQCPPGMVTRILMRFEGYTGKYLYHCHVLEHEANDMMRPFEVVA
jgi:spore coat protein A